MTYKQAQETILTALAAHGWAVKTGLKVPHATGGEIRLWFRPQAIYAGWARGSLQSRDFDREYLNFRGPLPSNPVSKAGRQPGEKGKHDEK